MDNEKIKDIKVEAWLEMAEYLSVMVKQEDLDGEICPPGQIIRAIIAFMDGKDVLVAKEEKFILKYVEYLTTNYINVDLYSIIKTIKKNGK